MAVPPSTTKPGSSRRVGRAVRWRNRVLQKVIFPLLFSTNKGERVLDHEWDNLIILDDCRFDAFSRAYHALKTEGTLREFTSRGTDTTSFLLENFSGSYHPDIVYVTANPRVNTLVPNNFFKVISVWSKGWNDEFNTVLPETMYQYALGASQRYPDKRLIIHFIQPHIPFVDLPDGAWIGAKIFPELSKSSQKRPQATSHSKVPFSVYLPPWNSDWYLLELSLGNRRIWELYQMNLARVLTYVARLLNELPGKSVVTADHGEAIGDRLHPLLPLRVYGHPPGVRMKSLTQVPWFVSTAPQTVQLKPPDQPAFELDTVKGAEDEKLVEERLKSLGYA